MNTVASLTARDFRLASCQATLFTPDEEVSIAKLFPSLLSRWSDRFDGEPTVLPMPDGVPREVPRAILTSRNGAWRCEIASARINVFWRRRKKEASDIGLDEFFRDATPLLTEYKEFLGARVGRIASVVSRYADHPSPGLFLSRHFCRDRWLKAPFNRPESFELHAHKRYVLAEFNVNSWVRNKTGRLGDDSTPIVLVEQDLNTVSEDATSRAFSKEQIINFFRVATRELDSILLLYFPGEER